MKKRLAFAIAAQAISVTILLVLAFQFFKQLNTLSAYSQEVEHTFSVLNQLALMESYVKDAETSSRGFLLTGKPEFLRLTERTKLEFLPAVDSLRYLIKDNPPQRALLKSVEKDAHEKISLLLQNIRYHNKMPADTLMARLDVGRRLMERLEANVQLMRDSELELLKQRQKAKKRYELLLPKNVRFIFLLTGLLTVVFGLWIYFELKQRFKYQDLLQRKLLELRQNNEELEQIAFAASHDLQEPLRKIRVFSDQLVLKMPDDSAASENYLMTKRINIAAATLQELITDLVTFNTLAQNKFEKTNLAIHLLVREAAEIAKQKLPGMQVKLHCAELPVIWGSETQLKLLFEHIFSNAIAFRSPGRALDVNVSGTKLKWSQIADLPSEMKGGYFYHLKIADNGLGFDEAFKNKMFKPFQRLHHIETETNGRRKGMGLAMCRRVMLNLGGWIDASGKVDQGAAIHLYFPIT